MQLLITDLSSFFLPSCQILEKFGGFFKAASHFCDSVKCSRTELLLKNLVLNLYLCTEKIQNVNSEEPIVN